MSTLLVLIITIIEYCIACEWFGDTVNTPAYPVNVCLGDYKDDKSSDGLTVFSIKYQCNPSNPNVLTKYEWTNTNCDGSPYKTTSRNKTKGDGTKKGYYFNCDGLGLCPFVRIKEHPMYNTSTPEQCSFNNQAWKEQAFITETCMDFTEDFGHPYGYYVDCTASQVIVKHYNTSDCDPNGHFDTTIIKEGCDESINYQTRRNYVSVDECKDQIIPSRNPIMSPTKNPTILSPTKSPVTIPTGILTKSPTIASPTNMPTTKHLTEAPSSG